MSDNDTNDDKPRGKTMRELRENLIREERDGKPTNRTRDAISRIGNRMMGYKDREKPAPEKEQEKTGRDLANERRDKIAPPPQKTQEDRAVIMESNKDNSREKIDPPQKSYEERINEKGQFTQTPHQKFSQDLDKGLSREEQERRNLAEVRRIHLLGSPSQAPGHTKGHPLDRDNPPERGGGSRGPDSRGPEPRGRGD